MVISIRGKVILLFTSLTVAISLLLSMFIYLYVKNSIEEDFFQRMKVRAGIAAKVNSDSNDVKIAFYNELRREHLELLPGEKEYISYQLPNALFFDSLQIQAPENFINNIKSYCETRFKHGEIYVFASQYQDADQKMYVIISANNEQGETLLTNFQKTFILGFIVSLALVYILSIILSKEIVTPLRNINKNLQQITASNLHMRLPMKKEGDEIAALTQNFNDMLDRLETSFETQSHFLNKAAHELRTPLTAITGEAELALSKPRSSEEYAKALQIIAKEAEQLKHHTSSLLELSQAGYNSKEPFKTPLRIDELLFAVKRLMDFTEPGNKVQINIDHLPEAENKITILANANLLKLALANIIQNGCKYSGQQDVDVSLTTTDSYCEIMVKDKGIGIPSKELKYIFDPFFRASNTESFKGYGIGLPLAQKIIRLHRGQLHYSSVENEGTMVIISLPFIENDNV